MGDVISLWANYGIILTGVAAAAALVWQAADFIYSKRGFIVPRLSCSTQDYNDKSYIVISTSVDNPGRRSATLEIAYVLLVHPFDIDHDEAITRIYGNKIEGKHIPAEVYKQLYRRCKDNGRNEVQVDIVQAGPVQVGENVNTHLIFKILPYYTELHSRIGGSGHMSSGIALQARRNGIWSIYFGVMGKNWSRRIFKDRLAFYTAHQHLIVQNISHKPVR